MPFHSKQRAALRTNPSQASTRHQDSIFPTFGEASALSYHPLYNRLLQSQCHRCHQRYLVATWNSEWSSGQNLDDQQSHGLGLLLTFKPERGTHPQICRGQLLKENYPPTSPQRGSSTNPNQSGHKLPPSSSSLCTSYCQRGRQQGLKHGPGPAGTYQCPLELPDMKLHP